MDITRIDKVINRLEWSIRVTKMELKRYNDDSLSLTSLCDRTGRPHAATFPCNARERAWQGKGKRDQAEREKG